MNLSNGNVLSMKVIAHPLLMLRLMGKALNDKNSSVLIPCQGIVIQILMNIFTMLLRKKNLALLFDLALKLHLRWAKHYGKYIWDTDK